MSHSDLAPSPWIARWLRGLPRGAHVLDFAAGRGRHSRYAASLGLKVLAVDRDREAIEALAADPLAHDAGIAPGRDGPIVARVLDLEQGAWTLPRSAFDAVIVSNYLFRPRYALVCGLLAPGGRLIAETFAAGNEAYGRPSNPSFLLRDGESFDRARSAGLAVLAYESGYISSPKSALVQRLCAVRGPLSGCKRIALD